MRALVTGGAGFIGSHIVEALLAEGHEVAVLDDLSSGRRENVPNGVKFYELDLRDREATRKAVLEFRPDAVSHQAAQASVSVSVREPRLDAEINVLGGLSLLDACTQSGVSVQRVVFASTGGAIYGEVPEGTRATESTRPQPISPYAIHKLTFEQLLAVYQTHRGLASTVLRYANVYGPRQDPHGEAGVVAIFFASVLAGKGLRINGRTRAGDDGCVRDYVYVSDVARLNALAIGGRVTDRFVNAGTGKTVTTRELATTIMSITGRSVALEPSAPRAGDLERSVLDPTLTLRYLERLVDLSEGMAKTHAFYASKRG
ncbi:MAG: NAD-dependent epimerase/dehydratase family protein [Polyangiaceae bacterium]